MKFLSFAIFALVALTSSQGVQVQTKRGAQQYAQAPATALAYTKVQQPVQKVVSAAPQPQYYTQQAAAAPSAYDFAAAQQQFQYQPQAQAYAQPTFTKYAAAPAPAIDSVAKVAATAYRQPFSSANDVSSFTYSSPVVTYNNLGLLSQVVGKIANPPSQLQAKVAAAPAAPAPAVYQTQAHQPAPVAYSAGPSAAYSAGPSAAFAAGPSAAYATVPASAYSSAPSSKYAALQQAQQAQRYIAAPAPQQYLSQGSQQAYLADPQAQALQAAQAYQATQTYSAQAAQSVPQSFYSQAPQYYGASQQLKQGSPGVEYAQ